VRRDNELWYEQIKKNKSAGDDRKRSTTALVTSQRMLPATTTFGVIFSGWVSSGSPGFLHYCTVLRIFKH
jgi:hypothetical protein